MFLDLKIKNANNVAWLTENCVASYFNFFVIGKLNESAGFKKNEYLKFRFVDFEKFLLICIKTLTFFSFDPLISKGEDIIIETASYIISLEGIYDILQAEKKVHIKVTFSSLKKYFGVYFDKEEFNKLLNGFLNIAIDVFCSCFQAKSVIRVFLEKVAQNNYEVEDYLPEVLLQSFQQKDYMKLCFEICECMQIDHLYSYHILDQILMYKNDLLIITKIRSWYNNSLVLRNDEKSTDTQDLCSESANYTPHSNELVVNPLFSLQ